VIYYSYIYRENLRMNTPWAGVFPAVTTAFAQNEQLDHEAMERHWEALMSAGVHGLVVLGSLGENGSLQPEEKQEIIRLAVQVTKGRVPVLSGVAETTTAAACAFVQQASAAGVDGFMVLPPMQYVSDHRETLHHLRSIAAATDRPIMIYNNPVAYRVDITPEMFLELSDNQRLVAIKESSDDVRRITEIKRLTGDRYALFVGVDDLAMESLLMGACGWVAGLVCAFPKETVALYNLIQEGRKEEALALYRWFVPLLRLDTDIKFVHYIKLAQAMVGLGSEHMRAPRLPLKGDERSQVQRLVAEAIKSRPELPSIGI
jgi:dihydrodipicolinate synthase/N-acetylneuraminate lyase